MTNDLMYSEIQKALQEAHEKMKLSSREQERRAQAKEEAQRRFIPTLLNRHARRRLARKQRRSK